MWARTWFRCSSNSPQLYPMYISLAAPRETLNRSLDFIQRREILPTSKTALGRKIRTQLELRFPASIRDGITQIRQQRLVLCLSRGLLPTKQQPRTNVFHRKDNYTGKNGFISSKIYCNFVPGKSIRIDGSSI